MILVLYIAGKFFVYCVVCGLAISMLRPRAENLVAFALKWGSIRFALGLLFGIAIVMSFAFWEKMGVSESVNLALSLGAIRYIEWGLLFLVMAGNKGTPFNLRANAWVLLGVGSSLLADWILSEAQDAGLINLKFFC